MKSGMALYKTNNFHLMIRLSWGHTLRWNYGLGSVPMSYEYQCLYLHLLGPQKNLTLEGRMKLTETKYFYLILCPREARSKIHIDAYIGESCVLWAHLIFVAVN